MPGPLACYWLARLALPNGTVNALVWSAVRPHAPLHNKTGNPFSCRAMAASHRVINTLWCVRAGKALVQIDAFVTHNVETCTGLMLARDCHISGQGLKGLAPDSLHVAAERHTGVSEHFVQASSRAL